MGVHLVDSDEVTRRCQLGHGNADGVCRSTHPARSLVPADLHISSPVDEGLELVGMGQERPKLCAIRTAPPSMLQRPL